MSQIKDITVGNVVEFLNSNNYTKSYLENFGIGKKQPQGFSINDYIDLCNRFVDFFFDKKTYNDIEKTKIEKYVSGAPIYINEEKIYKIIKNISGAPIYINEEKRFKIIKNITQISFIKMYPNIICELYKSGEINCITDELGKLYLYVLENHNNINSDKFINSESKILLRFFENIMYLISSNPYKYYGFDNMEKVVSYYSVIYDEISKLPGLIYNDVDTLFFDNSNTEIINLIDKLNIPYEIEHNIIGFFAYKMKYTILNSDGVKLNGVDVESLRRNGLYSPKYSELMNAFDLLNKILRSDKIKKIKNKINV